MRADLAAALEHGRRQEAAIQIMVKDAADAAVGARAFREHVLKRVEAASGTDALRAEVTRNQQNLEKHIRETQRMVRSCVAKGFHDAARGFEQERPDKRARVDDGRVAVPPPAAPAPPPLQQVQPQLTRVLTVPTCWQPGGSYVGQAQPHRKEYIPSAPSYTPVVQTDPRLPRCTPTSY